MVTHHKKKNNGTETKVKLRKGQTVVCMGEHGVPLGPHNYASTIKDIKKGSEAHKYSKCIFRDFAKYLLTMNIIFSTFKVGKTVCPFLI